MAQAITFTSPLPPSVNHYLGKRVAFACGKPYVQVYETADAKAYKKHMKKVLQRAVEEHQWSTSGEFDYVVCEMDVYLSQKHRDSDNVMKCLLDSITENRLVYDDSMIIPRVRNIFIDTNKPRIEVAMYVADKKGVFENEFMYNHFVSEFCCDCNRFNRNCSILKKCVENRITPEIQRKGLVVTACDSFKARAGKKSDKS